LAENNGQLTVVLLFSLDANLVQMLSQTAWTMSSQCMTS